jgi:hypothetical protein
MRALLCLFPLLLGSCAIPESIETLGETSPPPEFGRPFYVRFFAGTGAWIGGIIGGVASIVVLPITYPLSLLADDGLSENGTSEFLLFPATGGAAVGHALFGAPVDGFDWVFRRAWIDSPDPVTSYEFLPMPGPSIPRGENQPPASGQQGR